MKRTMVVLMIAGLMAIGGQAFAEKKDNHGQCVSTCVQYFNKSAADAGKDSPAVKNLAQQECSSYCKTNAGGPYFWDDEPAPPPDVVPTFPPPEPLLLPVGAPCFMDSQCQSGSCGGFSLTGGLGFCLP